MGRPFLVEYDDERPSSDYILCRACGTRVAFIQDFIDIEDEPTCVPQGIFIKIFNVEVPEEKPYQQVVDGKTLVDTYCVYCRDHLGWKFIAVPQGSGYYEGQFLMKLDKVSYSNGQPLSFIDQEEDINEQVPNEQDLGANEKNADQEGGNNEENPDQDGVLMSRLLMNKMQALMTIMLIRIAVLMSRFLMNKMEVLMRIMLIRVEALMNKMEALMNKLLMGTTDLNPNI